MFCPYCGEKMPDDAAFCKSCGKRIDGYTAPVQPEPADSDVTFSGVEYPQPVSTPEASKPARGMGWHKFLINFALWAGAVLNLASGIQMVSGSYYGGSAAQVYSLFPALKLLDVIYGLALVALAAYGIYTRYRLARFRADGPKRLIGLYIFSLCLTVLYIAATSIILGASTVDASVVGSLAGSVAMVFINRTYYKNRADLFVN